MRNYLVGTDRVSVLIYSDNRSKFGCISSFWMRKLTLIYDFQLKILLTVKIQEDTFCYLVPFLASFLLSDATPLSRNKTGEKLHLILYSYI